MQNIIVITDESLNAIKRKRKWKNRKLQCKIILKIKRLMILLIQNELIKS